MQIDKRELPEFKYWRYHDNDIVFYRVKNLLNFKGATVGMFNDTIWTNLGYNIKDQELDYWNILNNYTKVKQNYSKDINEIVSGDVKNKLINLVKDFGLLNKYIGLAQGRIVNDNGESRLVLYNYNIENSPEISRGETVNKIIKFIRFLNTGDVMALTKLGADNFYLLNKVTDKEVLLIYFPINNIIYKIRFKIYNEDMTDKLFIMTSQYVSKQVNSRMINAIGNFSILIEPIIDEVDMIAKQGNRKGSKEFKEWSEKYGNKCSNEIQICSLNGKSYNMESARDYFRKKIVESEPKKAHLRKGHTRRLKDGRVIEVRPSIIHKEDYNGFSKAYKLKE